MAKPIVMAAIGQIESLVLFISVCSPKYTRLCDNV